MVLVVQKLCLKHVGLALLQQAVLLNVVGNVLLIKKKVLPKKLANFSSQALLVADLSGSKRKSKWSLMKSEQHLQF